MVRLADGGRAVTWSLFLILIEYRRRKPRLSV